LITSLEKATLKHTHSQRGRDFPALTVARSVWSARASAPLSTAASRHKQAIFQCHRRFGVSFKVQSSAFGVRCPFQGHVLRHSHFTTITIVCKSVVLFRNKCAGLTPYLYVYNRKIPSTIPAILSLGSMNARGLSLKGGSQQRLI